MALVVLLSLIAFWTFHTLEGWSYLERNQILAQGKSFEPTTFFNDPRAKRFPAPSDLPHGVFRIEPYPVKAVDFLLATDLPTPLWNGGNYAGYLIWRLAPEHTRVFTDNRYDIYGGRFIRQEHSVLNGYTEQQVQKVREHGREGFLPWNEVLDQWNAQTLFLPATAAVNKALAESSDWVRVWQDFQFNIWVRRTEENQAVIERALDYHAPPPWIKVIRFAR